MILYRAAKPEFLSSWRDYKKSSSYRNGARWNSAQVPAVYFGSQVQNVMLELGNYMPNPRMANKLFSLGVFEISDAIPLYEIQPREIDRGWDAPQFGPSMQKFGDKILTGRSYGGLIAPSVCISDKLNRHKSNVVRASLCANIVLNPTHPLVKKTLKQLDTVRPIYNERLFSPVQQE